MRRLVVMQSIQPKHLFTVTDAESGIQADVSRVPRGYLVTLTDTDEGPQAAYTRRLYPTVDAALDAARSIIQTEPTR